MHCLYSNMHPAGVQALHILCRCHNATHADILYCAHVKQLPDQRWFKEACIFSAVWCFKTSLPQQVLLNGNHEGPVHPKNGGVPRATPSGPSTEPGPGSGFKRADPSVALPESEAEHAALAAVRGYPQPGDIVAYKLLEIGADWAPAVCFCASDH